MSNINALRAQYDDLRQQQKEVWELLKPANLELKRLQPLLKAAKTKNPKSQEYLDLKQEFRVKKDYQLGIVYKLADINGTLREVRTQLNALERKTSTNPAVEAKRLQKQQQKQAALALKAQKKEEARQKRLAELRAKEDDDDEFEYPKGGYRVPFLSDEVRTSVHHLTHNVFAVLHRQRKEREQEEQMLEAA